MSKCIEYKNAGTYEFEVSNCEIILEVIGGGGGGGKSLVDKKNAGGGGGEAGEYKKSIVKISSPQKYLIIVGQKGLSGLDGSSTIIKDFITEEIIIEAYGGKAGEDAKLNSPGAGGITRRTIYKVENFFKNTSRQSILNLAENLCNGSSGSLALSTDRLNGLAVGGNGGASFLGCGGSGGGSLIRDIFEINDLIGKNAVISGTGGGGGGATNLDKGTKLLGGNGADGYVKITYI